MEIYSNVLFFKYFVFVTSSVIILYFLTNLFLLHYFYNNKNIETIIEKYSYLPAFLISWLNQIKTMTENKVIYEYTMKTYIREIYINIFLIIVYILFI